MYWVIWKFPLTRTTHLNNCHSKKYVGKLPKVASADTLQLQNKVRESLDGRITAAIFPAHFKSRRSICSDSCQSTVPIDKKGVRMRGASCFDVTCM